MLRIDPQRPMPTPAPSATGRFIAAVGAVALSVGLAACGGGSDSPAPVAEPPAAPPPVVVDPPVSPPPVVAPPAADPTPTGFTAAGSILAADGVTVVGTKYTKAGTVPRTIVYSTAGAHYYELVTTTSNFANARLAAQAAGGDLASLTTAGELLFVKQSYPAPDLPIGGDASGANGAWVGLTQATATGTSVPGDGWTFLDGGTALAGNSVFWNAGEPNDGGNTVDANAENFGALFGGPTTAETDLKMFYDAGAVGSTETQTKFLIEYATKASIL